ncbi:MAG: protein kinase [Nannocystis sp.]|uniref:serine/threonine-protein kinase n=1 Tax=Nannocystis sp. TaxID=1962667 RepID=UPI002420D89C|nr:protein kinase [Nannocystis sp.]MBK9754410.1 protein kinase [Nannocystis sp.]
MVLREVNPEPAPSDVALLDASTVHGPAASPATAADAPPPAAPGATPPLTPAWIGRFLVIEPLGAGGMGQVYAAYDPELDRKVALKLLHGHVDAGDRHGAERLHREAQAMARLSHPNVVTVHEIGGHAGQIFIAMELVAGVDLGRWLAAEPRPWGAVLAMFRAAGEGLAAAHEAGLVHRDFKPANVLVGDDGRARVADFGLVHASGSPTTRPGHAADVRTGAGAVMGTPAYMAPEQLRGEATDARTDVFAFCLALWEALLGSRPFAAGSLDLRLQAIERGLPDDPPRLPLRERWLRPLLRRGLAADPDARWPGMRPLLAALAHDPVLTRARRRRTALFTAVSLALGAALLFGGSALWSFARTYARESGAQARLEATLLRLGALRSEGSHDEAERVFAGFLAAPEHHGTRAEVQARRWQAEDRRQRGDLDGAIDAYTSAYAATRHADQVPELLLGLAAVFRERQAWASLSWVLATLETMPSMAPRIARLQRDVALHRRDVATAAGLDPAGAALFAALGQAEASDLRARRAETIDLEGDGATSVMLWASLAGTAQVKLVRATRGLPAIATFDDTLHHVVPHTAPGPGRVVGEQRRLLVWDGARFVQEAEWPGGFAAAVASADLDGDHAREVYVGISRNGRRLLGLRPGPSGWEKFIPAPGLSADAEVLALAAGDLDGDGRDELVAALGPPVSHGLRVLRSGAPAFPLVSWVHRRHGTITDLQIVPGRAGPRLAVASTVDPAAHPEDPPAGLHLYRLHGGELIADAQYLLEPGATLRHLVVADLDGDGEPELIGEVQRGEEVDLAIFRPESAGGSLRISGLLPLTAVQLDADLADELLVADTLDDDRVWTLGVGDQALPIRDLGRPPVAVPPPPGVADDPVQRGQWTRADELAGLGLLDAASQRFAELGASLPQGPPRAATLARAGELAADAGLLARAAGLFAAAAADDPAHLARAADSWERLGRFDDARRTLRALGPADPAIAAELARYEQLVASERVLRFDGQLDPAWRAHDPLRLRHDPLRTTLVAELDAGAPVLSLPFVAGPDFSVRIELSLAEIGLGGSFGFQLADSCDAKQARHVVVRAAAEHGASADPGARLVVSFRAAEVAADIPLPTPDQRLAIELVQLGSLGEQRLSLSVDDVVVGTRGRPLADPQRPGCLAIKRTQKPGGIAAPWSRVELHRVTTRGLTLLAPPPDPWAQAGAHLIAGDGAAALAALAVAEAAGEPAPPELPVWRALALATAGRGGEAVALLRERIDIDALDAPLQRAAIRLLRGRPELAPLLQDALGPGYLPLFVAAWAPLLANDLRRPTTLHALLEHPPRLDLPTEAPLSEAILALRVARVAAFAQLGQPARAARELAEIDLTQAAATRETRAPLRAALPRLAALELAGGHPEAAFAHLHMLAQVCSPEVFADLVSAEPGLLALQSDPRWRELPGV